MSEITPSELEPGQTILEHLGDLQKRITWAFVSWVIGTVISFVFAPRVIAFITAPASQSSGEPLQLLGPTDSIEIYFKVALVCGGIFAMPFMLYQVWLFIAPALERKEKGYAVLFIFSAMFLFLTGIVFSWYVLLPPALNFLGEFQSEVFDTQWTAQEYTSFTSTFLFWLGVSFEMPLVIYLLAVAGLVTSTLLREQWRFAIVGIAVIAAVVTPSIDPITMILTMAPLTVLYGLSILLAMVGERQFARTMAIE